jgi:tetratricopeptide (TPR) repeat protein
MVPDSLFLRVANLPRVFLFYFYVLILPFNLRVERFFSLSKTLDLPIIFSTLLFILISLWMVKIRRSSRLIFFFSAWFFINLLAVANIIFPLNAAISEHWLYLPSIGFFYLAAVLLNKTLEGRWLFAPLENPAVQSGNDNNIRINSMQRAEYKVPHFLAGFMKWDPTLKFKKTILMIIVVTLCLLTVSRNFEWKSPITLFESTLKATKGRLSFRDLRVCLNLACAYAQRGRLDEAIEEFKKILIIRPDSKKIRYNLGLAYANKGLDEEAEKELLEALNIDSHFLQPYYLLGLIYLKKQNYDKANAIWDRMLQVKPEYPQDEILLKRVILMKEKLKQKLPVLEKDFKLGE